MTTPISTPYYGHTDLRSTIVEWTSTDSIENFNENIKDLIKYNTIHNAGFDKPGCITYSHNSRGFRDREFDNTPSGIALGCSITEGVGVPAESTWSSQLSNLLKTNIWNLGVGGGSLDTAFNALEYYLDELNAQFVVLCAPFESRLELFRGKHTIRIQAGYLDHRPLIYQEFFKQWFTTEKNSLINQRKNILAMQQLCNQRNIPFYHLQAEGDFKLDCGARDCAHPGVGAHLEFALKMHNKITGNTI